MDVILLFNGLGNQMSQYAFYLKKKQLSGSARFVFSRKSRNVHNGYELDRVFGIKEEDTLANRMLYIFYLGLAYKKLRFISQPVIRFFGLLGSKVFNEEEDYNFNPQLLQSSPGIKFYAGGWHAGKYFSDIKDKVLDAFQFNTADLGTANTTVLKKIKTCASVSVHVRRGDFLNAENYHKFGSVCTLSYFLSAIREIRSRVDNPHFFFFTNDYPWVKENFTGEHCTIVDINTAGDSWKDMFLISNCLHNISSNGSFSWWASWLNKNDDKIVIVPRNFVANKHFEGLYPENWLQLSDY